MIPYPAIAIKRIPITYLDLKFEASPEGADIKGFLDPCLLTIT
jgi:hypothetical protein